MSLAKLSTRLNPCPNEIQSMIVSFSSHLNVDLQQRGIEFSQLFRDYNNLRPALLEKMPPMQINKAIGQNGNGMPDEIMSGPDLIETEGEEIGITIKSTGVSDSVSEMKKFPFRSLAYSNRIFFISEYFIRPVRRLRRTQYSKRDKYDCNDKQQ